MKSTPEMLAQERTNERTTTTTTTAAAAATTTTTTKRNATTTKTARIFFFHIRDSQSLPPKGLFTRKMKILSHDVARQQQDFFTIVSRRVVRCRATEFSFFVV
jgi:hypothetical protein